MKENLHVQFNHDFDPEVRLDPETHNIDVPLETSLTPQAVKRKYKLKVKKKKGNPDSTLSMSSTPNLEAPAGHQDYDSQMPNLQEAKLVMLHP
jgi:hypothetical protein